MPRYFFDVHDNGPAEWDDVGRECELQEDVEYNALALIKAVAGRQKARGTIGVTTTVIVHRNAGGIALTAIAKPGRDIQFIWTPA